LPGVCSADAVGEAGVDAVPPWVPSELQAPMTPAVMTAAHAVAIRAVEIFAPPSVAPTIALTAIHGSIAGKRSARLRNQ
jgi:hypothetical protein